MPLRLRIVGVADKALKLNGAQTKGSLSRAALLHYRPWRTRLCAGGTGTPKNRQHMLFLALLPALPCSFCQESPCSSNARFAARFASYAGRQRKNAALDSAEPGKCLRQLSKHVVFYGDTRPEIQQITAEEIRA